MLSKELRLSVPLLAILASCGSSGTSSQDQASTVADLCAGAAVQSSNGIATSVGCAFENQLNNIYNHGTASAQTLYDNAGRLLGSASRSCDVWWQATDADGVTILLNRDTGEIRAHGMVHPSMPTTTLPQHVPAPIVAH